MVAQVIICIESAKQPNCESGHADEVRSLVADLAHLAYSRGLPGSFSANAPTAQSDHMGVGIPPPQLLQQAMMTVPVHLIPGHPSFDQHAYQMLVQQQQQELHDQEQEQQQHQQEQQQHQYSYQQQHQQLLHSEQQQPVNAGMTQQRDGMQAAHEEGTSSGMPADQHAVLDSDAHEGAAQQQQQHDKSVRPAASPLD